MRTIKAGDKFRHLNDDILILDRRDSLILAKIVGSSGTYYDISQLRTDSSGDEIFYPSMNTNGLAETIAGGQKVPKSLEDMTTKFKETADTIETSRRSKAETLAALDARTQTRAKKIIEIRNFRDDCRTEIAALVNNGAPVSDILKNKKVAVLTAEIAKCETVLNLIR